MGKREIRKYVKENCTQPKEIREEIITQIEVCQDLHRPFNETQILELCATTTVIQVSNYARKHKFA